MKKSWQVESRPEVRKFTPTESSWLACAIDGEGSVGLYDYGREGRRVLVQMGNTSKPFVKEMKRIIGCGSSIRRKKFDKGHKGRKPMFYFSLKGSARCYWVLKQITKYLIIKKEKSLGIVHEIETTPFGRWKNSTSTARKRQSKKSKDSWKNPKIRKARLDGMRRRFACLKKRS